MSHQQPAEAALAPPEICRSEDLVSLAQPVGQTVLIFTLLTTSITPT